MAPDAYETVGDRWIRWAEQADENMEKWGLQDTRTLLLALQEELGELTQSVLEHQAEGEPAEPIQEELDDMVALCLQFQERISEGVEPGEEPDVVQQGRERASEQADQRLQEIQEGDPLPGEEL